MPGSGSGESRAAALGDGTVLQTGKSHVASIADGTVLTRGESAAGPSMAAGTVLMGGKSSASLARGLGTGHTDGLGDGTVLAGGHGRTAEGKRKAAQAEPLWRLPEVEYDEDGRPLPWCPDEP